MDYATTPATSTTGPDRGTSAPSGPCVLLVDAHSARRAASARQLAACLPGVTISECTDSSTAMLRLAAVKHALIVLHVGSCEGRAMLASQYWRLTEPHMQQILVHDDAPLPSYLDLGQWRGIENCSWADMPDLLLSWGRRYRQDIQSKNADIPNAKFIPARTGALDHVFLIDDDKFMLTVLSDLLHGLGAKKITMAANGISALQAYDSAAPAPNAILCDLDMPGCDGFEFMEQLSSRGFAGGIIVVSGMDERTRTSAALAAHFRSLKILAALSKPVDEAELRAALAKLK